MSRCFVFLHLLFAFVSSELESSSGSEKEGAKTGNLLGEPRPRTTRPWTPLSLFNSDYVALIKEREQTLVKHDFIRENIVSQMHIITESDNTLRVVSKLRISLVKSKTRGPKRDAI